MGRWLLILCVVYRKNAINYNVRQIARGMTIYGVFQKLLKIHGVTELQVARELRISPSVFYNWKRGKSSPSYKTLKKISDYFDVSDEYLLGERKFISQEVLNLSPSENQIAEKELSEERIQSIKHIISKIQDINKNQYNRKL